MSGFLFSVAIAAQMVTGAGEPLAVLALYNPTQWEGPCPVEIATGRIATPGLIDWGSVALRLNGADLPFALREGRAHWKAGLAAPIESPKAEDLLVFSCSVPPETWARVEIVPGMADGTPAVSRADGLVTVRYERLEAVIGEDTSILAKLSLFGTPVLAGPLAIAPRALPDNAYTFTGPIGPGHARAEISIADGKPLPYTARLVSVSSSPVFTELNFVLTCADRFSLGLTYRFRSCGVAEIWADERPVEGPSPWRHHAVTYALLLTGDWEPLPYLEDRLVFYGFKDFAAAIQQTARHYGHCFELGEEYVNGRRWVRRLIGIPPDKRDKADALLELIDKGFIVDVSPVTAPVAGGHVTGPEGTATIVRDLQEVLGASPGDATPVKLELSEDARLEGDGFAISSNGAGGILVRARTRLGLGSAVSAIADCRGRHPECGVPLIARNPVVSLRGGGFGGGTFEVDFPYGTDEEWEQTFDKLLDSGMNMFWCLGMWGNWKLPVSYKYMPELRSDDPEAYDESSGTLFREFAQHRDHGLKLIHYLRERGAAVGLWLPIGCVPTTFAQKYPEAMMPESFEQFWGRAKGIPCFTHPKYIEYLDAFLREVTETYPLDAIIMVRDDNGGLCTCDRCKQFVAQSRTQSGAWEQYLIIYQRLKEAGFAGKVGVYPYFDGLTPEIDALLPEDLFLAGHGASTAALTRNQERIGHMADTWLDNLYTNFRLPPSPRMRRFLSDRCTFWIGGAYRGTELPWESIGYFGWEPTATPNSLRYEWGVRTFGRENALTFAGMSDAYEHLWEINARHMLPKVWLELRPGERQAVTAEAEAALARYEEQLAQLEQQAGGERHSAWFKTVRVFPAFMRYHLRRLDAFAKVYNTVREHSAAIDGGGNLPEEVRLQLLAEYQSMYAYARKYANALEQAPGGMFEATRNMTMPYKEWMAGYDGWLDPLLDRPQFAGTLDAEPVTLTPGQPFTLRLVLRNTGICPWIAEAGQRLTIEGASQAGLPEAWVYDGEPAAPGDTRTIEFEGRAPDTPGKSELTIVFYNPYRVAGKIAEKKVVLSQ
ncbi:MAG TPA: hypothetical protein PLJ71_01710 [Candidatus Hydrogenedentes bacterium]|nr:hypothetical protein [Candidatus Hydrogenedentota bacterium]HQM47369.1 hypothetical protein [Candidatus Hydrogenedentota bacterium]